MQWVTLKYVVGETEYFASFEALDTEGLDEPEGVRLFPGIQDHHTNGSIRNQNVGIGRNITVVIDTIEAQDGISAEDRKAFLYAFLIKREKYVALGHWYPDILPQTLAGFVWRRVEFINPSSFKPERPHGTRLTKLYRLEMTDADITT